MAVLSRNNEQGPHALPYARAPVSPGVRSQAVRIIAEAIFGAGFVFALARAYVFVQVCQSRKALADTWSHTVAFAIAVVAFLLGLLITLTRRETYATIVVFLAIGIAAAFFAVWHPLVWE